MSFVSVRKRGSDHLRMEQDSDHQRLLIRACQRSAATSRSGSANPRAVGFVVYNNISNKTRPPRERAAASSLSAMPRTFSGTGAKNHPSIRAYVADHSGMTSDPNHRTSSTNDNSVTSNSGQTGSKPANQPYASRKYGGYSKIFRPFALLSRTIWP